MSDIKIGSNVYFRYEDKVMSGKVSDLIEQHRVKTVKVETLRFCTELLLSEVSLYGSVIENTKQYRIRKT